MEACRICLTQKDLVNMRAEYISERSIYSVFLEFCGLEIPEEQSALVCQECKDFLSSFRTKKREAMTNTAFFLHCLVKMERLEPIVADTLPVCEVLITKEEDPDIYYGEYVEETPRMADDDEIDVKDNELLTPLIQQKTASEPKPVEKVKKQQKKKSKDDHPHIHWCGFCFQTFRTKSELVKHRTQEILDNGGMECHFCGTRKFNRHGFQSHMSRVHLIDRNIRFGCDLCGKTFSQKGQVLNHKRAEHFKIFVYCPICNKAMKSKTRLNKHIKIVHEKQRNVICNACGKGFGTKAQFKVHYTQIHTTLKPYPCSVCERKFSSLANKIVHEKIHGNQRVRCDECDFITNTQTSLNSHKIRHKNVYNYSCAICGQQFKCAGSLRMHKYTHEENSFECQFCNKKYSRPQNLKAHIATIHQQQRYPCPTCHEEFSSKNCLRKHIKVLHKGVRYFCKCGLYFDRRTRYTKHKEECRLAAVNEPEIKSIYTDKLILTPIGRPGKFMHELKSGE